MCLSIPQNVIMYYSIESGLSVVMDLGTDEAHDMDVLVFLQFALF